MKTRCQLSHISSCNNWEKCSVCSLENYDFQFMNFVSMMTQYRHYTYFINPYFLTSNNDICFTYRLLLAELWDYSQYLQRYPLRHRLPHKFHRSIGSTIRFLAELWLKKALAYITKMFLKKYCDKSYSRWSTNFAWLRIFYKHFVVCNL